MVQSLPNTLAEPLASSSRGPPRSTRSRSRSPIRRERSPSPPRRPAWERERFNDRERPVYGDRGRDVPYGRREDRRSWNDRRDDDRRPQWRERRFDRAFSPRRSRSPSPRPRINPRTGSPEDGQHSPRRRGYRQSPPPLRRGQYGRPPGSRTPRSVSPPPLHPRRGRSPSPMLQYSPPPEVATPPVALSRGKARDMSPTPPPRKVEQAPVPVSVPAPAPKPIPTFPRKALPTGPRNPDLIVLKPAKPVRPVSPVKKQASPVKKQASPVRSPVKKPFPTSGPTKTQVSGDAENSRHGARSVSPVRKEAVGLKSESMLERLKRTAKAEAVATPAQAVAPTPISAQPPVKIPMPAPVPAPAQATPISSPAPNARSRVSWGERNAPHRSPSPPPPPIHTSSPIPEVTAHAQAPVAVRESLAPILRGLEVLPTLSIEFEGEWEKAFAAQQSIINNMRTPYSFAAAQYRLAGNDLASADLEWRAAMERRRIAEAALDAIRLT